MKDLELSLVRRYFNPEYTIGKLSADQEYFSDSLEDCVRDLVDRNHDGDFNDPGEGKIFGQTAIPYGRYQVIVTYSPKFGKRLPEILNVPGFTNIRMHHTRTAKGVEGCIGIGLNKKKGELWYGEDYEDKLVEIIDKADSEGRKTFITIK